MHFVPSEPLNKTNLAIDNSISCTNINNMSRRVVSISILVICLSACDLSPDFDFIRSNPLDPVIPTIEITFPSNNYKNHHTDAINFIAKVNDISYSPHTLHVNIYSDIDGFLDKIIPDASGKANAQINDLSKAEHVIFAEVVNPDGYTRTDSIKIYNNAAPRVNITCISLIDNSYIDLSWEESTDTDFESYGVHRINSNNQTRLVVEIQDISSTTFRDFAPLDSLYRYYVVSRSSAYPEANNSEIKSQERKLFNSSWVQNPGRVPTFNGIKKVLMYPDSPTLLFQRSHEIAAFNFVENKVIGRMDLEQSIIDVANNGAGTEIYVLPPGRERIDIYDATTFNQKEYFIIPRAIDIKSNNRGLIFLTMGFGGGNLYGMERSRMPNRGTHIDFNRGHMIRTTQTTNDVYYVWVGSPRSLFHASHDSEGNITEVNKWPYHGGPAISEGNFEAHPHNQYVVSSMGGNVFEPGPSLALKKTLAPGGEYVDFTFDDTGYFLFAADRRGWIDVYEDLTHSRRIEMTDKPRFLQFDKEKGRLVILAYSDIVQDYEGVLVFEL